MGTIKINTQRGFTLTEIAVVLVIIILARLVFRLTIYHFGIH